MESKINRITDILRRDDGISGAMMYTEQISWILYMLDGVEQTSLVTIELINNIHRLMGEIKEKIKAELPKIYSKDLVEILFMHPYAKIEFLVDDLGLHRHTASVYLKELEKLNILHSIKLGRGKYFINVKLFDMLKKGI